MRMLITVNATAKVNSPVLAVSFRFCYVRTEQGVLECTETIADSAVYRCICPYGFDGERCEGYGEIRAYTKGPVTKDPGSERRFVAEIVVASFAILAAAAVFIQIRKRGNRKQLFENDDGLDDLMMIGRFADNATDDEDDDMAGIETT